MIGGLTIKLMAFYLMAFSLLLAQVSAEENRSESTDDLRTMNISNQTLWNGTVPNSTGFNSSEFNSAEFDYSQPDSSEFNDLDFSGSYYDSVPYSMAPDEPQAISLAFPASDLNGDDAADLLVMNISSDAGTGSFESQISALNGADGSLLWQKEYPGSLVFAMTAEDLDGDGLTDIMVDEIVAGGSFIPYSSVSALDGSDGTVIWSRPQILAMTIAYPIQDSNGDNASEFLVHTFGMDGINNTLLTKIARVNGADGTKLDERIFSGSLAIEYPAGNFTSDTVQDSIAAIYQLEGSLAGEMEEAPLNITATIFEAIDGRERTALWNGSFSGPALAVPVMDLTGDGQDELVVYLLKSAKGGSFYSDIAVLQGSNGGLLWQQSFAGSLAFVTPGPDLTGDGQQDLIVYKLGEDGVVEVLAVKGDDGRLLWSRGGMVYIPP
jgi:hypothetical protein